MLDIDHFKQVNDQHGHAAGDEALRAVGGLLSGTTRAGDMACRLGGEEFAVLLPGMEAAAALLRAELWRAAFVALQVPGDGAVDGETLRLSASFGVASFPQEGDTLAALMKLADHRLYRAKALGRNRVVGPDDDR
jgi:diguanylate cyclase (GGDEF)-like protein